MAKIINEEKKVIVKPIPKGFHTVTPYFLVDNIDGFITFLKNAFGAKVHRNTSLPNGTILNSEIKIGNSMIMISGSSDEFPPAPINMYLYVDDTDVTYNQSLNAGGVSIMEPEDQFYGDRNAGIKDPFGNTWWIATHLEDITNAELQKRTAKFMDSGK